MAAKPGSQSYLPLKRSLEDVVTHYESAEMALDLPALYQLLCHAKREGRYRASARLTFFAQEGRLKASVYDPDTGSVWFATLEGHQDALTAVDKLLQQGRGEWRESKVKK